MTKCILDASSDRLDSLTAAVLLCIRFIPTAYLQRRWCFHIAKAKAGRRRGWRKAVQTGNGQHLGAEGKIRPVGVAEMCKGQLSKRMNDQ